MTVNKEKFDNTTSEAEQVAAAWFVKLDVEQNASEDELIEFVDWLRVNPVHEQLYERCKFTWGLSTEIENDPEIASYIGELSIQETAPPENRRWLDQLSSLPAIAAGLLVAVFIGFFAANHDYSNEALPVATRYHTAIGEQRSFELDDGSNLMLNTRTSKPIPAILPTKKNFQLIDKPKQHLPSQAQSIFIVLPTTIKQVLLIAISPTAADSNFA